MTKARCRKAGLLTVLTLLASHTILAASGIGGREKLSPQIREVPLSGSSPIDMQALQTFLSRSRVIEKNQLDAAGHVLEGTDGQILLGAYSQFYARGLRAKAGDRFQLFRAGRPITDPISHENYGLQAEHLGMARVVEGTQVRGNDFEKAITTLEVESANEEIRPGDRLTAVFTENNTRNISPTPATHRVSARVIMIPRGVDEAGQRDVVIINAGQNQQLRPGHVLNIGAHSAATKDPLTGETVPLPDKSIGTAMVFSVMPKIAYAVLLETTAAVKIGDVLRASGRQD